MRHLIVLLLVCLGASVAAFDFDATEFQPLRPIEGVSWNHLEFTSLVDHYVVEESGVILTWDKSDGWVKRVQPDGVVEYLVPMSGSFDRTSSYALAESGQYLMVEQYIGTFIIANLETGRFIELRFPDHGLSASPLDFGAVMLSDLLVYEPNDAREFHSFQIIETDNNIDALYRDPDETRAFIDETYEGTAEFHYDSEGYLFYGERLVTTNGDTFIASFGQERIGAEEARNLRRSDATLIGVDAMGNYYWQIGRLILIYDRNGRVVKAIGYAAVPHGGGLQIDLDGNIYLLNPGGITPGVFHLLWIENTWSTQTSGGWSTPSAASEPHPTLSARLVVPEEFLGSPVALRESASVAAQSVGHLDAMTEVFVLEETTAQRIGALSEPWYLVVTADGTEGWIYGVFLEFSE